MPSRLIIYSNVFRYRLKRVELNFTKGAWTFCFIAYNLLGTFSFFPSFTAPTLILMPSVSFLGFIGRYGNVLVLYSRYWPSWKGSFVEDDSLKLENDGVRKNMSLNYAFSSPFFFLLRRKTSANVLCNKVFFFWSKRTSLLLLDVKKRNGTHKGFRTSAIFFIINVNALFN